MNNIIQKERPDILAKYSTLINYDCLLRERQNRKRQLKTKHWSGYIESLNQCPSRPKDELMVQLDRSCITVGQKGELSEDEERNLSCLIDKLIPWRKGPFSLFGIEIDAEWRSDFKWSRIEPHLDSVEGARVADIGCSNGYYMFRSAALNPEIVVGFDPSERNYYSFDLIQSFVGDSKLAFEMLGVEYMHLFPGFFDVVLCMGVLYHRRNPLADLISIRESMKPGAQIIVESQAIAGEDSVALFPSERYCKARNVYFIPTANCLVAWLEKTGFVDVEIFSDVLLTEKEQRQTRYSPYESLKDYLNSEDSSLTIEGYPAPRRVAVKARSRQ